MAYHEPSWPFSLVDREIRGRSTRAPHSHLTPCEIDRTHGSFLTHGVRSAERTRGTTLRPAYVHLTSLVHNDVVCASGPQITDLESQARVDKLEVGI